MSEPPAMVKLVVETGGVIETPWVTPLGGGRFRLENMPLLAYGVSLHDVVEAHPRWFFGRLTFTRVVKKSGCRTVRVFTPEGNRTPEALRLREMLTAGGCSWAGGLQKMLAVNVPGHVELAKVRAILEAAAGIRWEQSDPYVPTK
jgi:hypothetical protein